MRLLSITPLCNLKKNYIVLYYIILYYIIGIFYYNGIIIYCNCIVFYYIISYYNIILYYYYIITFILYNILPYYTLCQHIIIPTYVVEDIDPQMCVGFETMWLHVGVNSLKPRNVGT